MAFRQDSFGELKVPLAWTAGVALVVCVVIGIGLMLSDRRGTVENTTHAATQQAVDTVVTPVGDVLSAPGRWIGGAFAFIGSYWDAAGENRRLKRDLVQARRAEDRMVALAMENARLRTMLGVGTDPPMPMVTARVVFDTRGPYRRAQLANVGSAKGVAVGYPAISERGVIGRVIGVSSNASRILLLKDVSSRTPVMIARTNARAILTGDGGDNPRLENLRGVDPVKAGDRILTSGDGGVYPRGLPVGRAVKGLDGAWRVALDSDTAPLDWIRILQFKDFAQLADQNLLQSNAMPGVITEDPQARIRRDAASASTKPPPPGSPGASSPPALSSPQTSPPATKPPASKPPVSNSSDPQPPAGKPATPKPATSPAAPVATTPGGQP